MKRYSFSINDWFARILFKPIRNKQDVIKVLMSTIKFMTVNYQVKPEHCCGEIILLVSKMSRIFFITENKYFSINFPFTVEDNNDELNFLFNGDCEIDSQITSEIIGLVGREDCITSSCVIEFADQVDTLAAQIPELWPLLIRLLTFEDGYIRYDDDAEHENGLIHPKNHYDVFYSSNTSFKIGLRDSVSTDSLIDMLSPDSACHFLE
ncbi:MAG: hypothetical protein PSN44_09240 [Gammaproteobacteria bacterium]|nr:hypothetical protein [Gammaproteobacteria bacterium]